LGKVTMPLLNESQIQTGVSQLSGWSIEGNTLTRTWKLKDFIEAVNFVNRLVEPAEAAGHHPDLAISYNRVTVTLTTHDAGGLTEKDLELAKIISEL
jgi:4a-hydroxytetrahydrobiopterin dehydratase